MVVLSASVCTRQGKPLVSRQFVEMNRLRVEGLLAAFPKLVGHAKQHTYVETDSVRYVYQPLEGHMYLLLITTKASNIVEDLGTLRLLAKLVPDITGGFSEHLINENAFELIFAFDEVLTAGGYKEESTTLSLIRTNLMMDSHEEKIHNALKESKESQAREEMQRQAKNIRDRQMAQMKQNFMQGGGTGTDTSGGGSGMVGFGSGGGGGGGGGGYGDGSGGYGGAGAGQYNSNGQYGAAPAPTPEAPKVLATSGMKLGGAGMGSKKDNLMAAMAAEDNLFPMAGGGAGAAAGKSMFDMGAAPKPVATPSTPLSVVLDEKISVSLNREGGVEACEVKGTLTLTANTDAGASAVVAINKAALPASFTYATHPKVDKKSYEQKGILALKGGKPLPTGRGVGLLRWSQNSMDAAPITINCWPEDEGTGTINVNIEMELLRKDLVLLDVNILLPLGTTDPPAIESIDGEFKHDAASGMMCWHFDQVDASTNPTGSLEFSITGADTDAFFPVQVGFRSESLLCPMQITSITNASTNAPIPNQLTQNFGPESYTCA